MKKIYLILPLLLGAALALFLVFRNYGAPAPVSGGELIAKQSNGGGHVTEAQWGEDTHEATGSHEANPLAASEDTNKPKEPVTEAKLTLAAKVAKVSGIERKFKSMAPMLKEQLEMMISDQLVSEKDRDEYLDKFRKNLSAEAMLGEYNRELAENFTPEELNQLSETYENPHVKQFSQLNNDLSDPEKLREMQDEISEFMKDPEVDNIPSERRAQIAKVDKAFNVSNQAVDLTTSLFNLSGEGGDPEATKQISGAIKKEVLKGLVYTTRGFPDQDLDDFAKVVDNDNFRKSNTLVHKVVKNPLMNFVNAMNKASKDGEKDKGKANKEDVASSAKE